MKHTCTVCESVSGKEGGRQGGKEEEGEKNRGREGGRNGGEEGGWQSEHEGYEGNRHSVQGHRKI